MTGTSLWRHRDFRRLWVGDTVSQVGTQLSELALPVLAITLLGAGEVEVGLLAACQTIAFLVVGLPAGAWVDRWPKQRVLVAGDVLRAVALGSIPVAWALGVLALPQLFVVAVVMGVGTVFFDVAYQSYLPHLVSVDRLVDGNAKLQASASVAQVAGPAVGGAALRVMAAPVLVAVDAVSYVFSALAIARISHVEIPADRGLRRSLRAEIAEGVRFVLRDPLLSRIAACTSLGNLFLAASGALFPLLLLRDLDLAPWEFGLVNSIAAVGGLTGAVVAAGLARRVGEGRIIPLSSLLMVPFLAVTPIAAMLAPAVAPVPLLAGGAFVVWAMIVIYNVTQVSFRQRLCPPELLGRMNASIRFLLWGTAPIGAVAGGVLASRIGIVATLWITVAGSLVAALPVVFSPLIRMRELPGPPASSDRTSTTGTPRS